MIITAAQLEKHHACSEGVLLFRRLYGDSVEVTEAGCLAVVDQFDWSWAAANLLDFPAWKEYEHDRSVAEKEYERAVAPTWVEHDIVTTRARAEYGRAQAAAFARAYASMDARQSITTEEARL